MLTHDLPGEDLREALPACSRLQGRVVHLQKGPAVSRRRVDGAALHVELDGVLIPAQSLQVHPLTAGLQSLLEPKSGIRLGFLFLLITSQLDR